MSKASEIHCYDYINHPYDKVREVLTTHALSVFQTATKGASSRANDVASGLRVDLGGISIEAGINIKVTQIEEKEQGTRSDPVTQLNIEWEASNAPRLFPLMKAELRVYPLTATETQLDFLGAYEPPMGALGKVMNSMVGHRVAEASVHRFVNDVAGYLRKAIT